MKKTVNSKASALMLLIMMLLSQISVAGVSEKFNKYIGSEFTNLSGFYIILGVAGAAILTKVLHYFFLREKEEAEVKPRPHISHHRHHRHRPLIKKTS